MNNKVEMKEKKLRITIVSFNSVITNILSEEETQEVQKYFEAKARAEEDKKDKDIYDEIEKEVGPILERMA